MIKNLKILSQPSKLLRLMAMIAGAITFAVSACVAQSTPKRSLVALSKADHTLSIVDPVTLKVIAHIPVGPDPHEVTVSSDGKTAYVSNMGNGNSYEINVIDLVGQKRLPNIDTRPLYGPHGIVFEGGKVWFTAQDSKSVGRYDPAGARLDWSMGTGQDRTHMIYVTPDEKKIYATNVRSGTVSIIENVHRDWVETIIPVSKGSEGFDVSPDGHEIWTAAADDGVISIIDTASRKVTATIDAKAVGANRLKFTPDGKRVFISSLRSGDLFIYDAATHKQVKRLNIGHGAAGILMDPDGTRAFVACTGDNYIAVIDLKTLTATGQRIDIGGPDGMDWAVQK
jgi:YVTN family beta-propeller protein